MAGGMRMRLPKKVTTAKISTNTTPLTGLREIILQHSLVPRPFRLQFLISVFIGASLSEPHINVLNASGVCMYMYVCIRTSYRKFCIR